MHSSFTSLLALSIVLVSTAAAPHSHSDQLMRRFSGQRMTYYTPGLGACGDTDTASQYVYGSGSSCGSSITITYNGNSVAATVVDKCTGCSGDELDLSQGLFECFADASVGVIYGEWEWN
ncbi:plant expansin [Coniophora puteana RWD-64-598 SS2]|uniref:Plant expansin n=1 Tax=Coniophora puteana (strain RWD-64-598) TaxID=741705 RepID=R7SEM7_CONPW|nr:plant expansin [Coniophora puteana RWD-64-598 SS2]EIW74628.1 plant expansin [Coniophora puteana RWD-64-598 SS2]